MSIIIQRVDDSRSVECIGTPKDLKKQKHSFADLNQKRDNKHNTNCAFKDMLDEEIRIL